MTRLSALLLLCVLAAGMLPAQAASTRMPYGSFLTRPVSDAGDLAQLIREDKVVARRFANFYGISNDALADYIDKHGKIVTLSTSKTYLEYFLDNQDKVCKHHKLLRPGTRLLVVQGLPVVDLGCGNPMNKALPKIVEKVEPVVQELKPAPPAPPAPVEALEVPQVLPEEPVIAPPAPEPTVQVLAEIPMDYPVAVSPGVQELAWLLPGLVGLGTLGGGSSTPVPEPAGLMVLGFGAAGFVLTCRRLRNR